MDVYRASDGRTYSGITLGVWHQWHHAACYRLHRGYWPTGNN